MFSAQLLSPLVLTMLASAAGEGADVPSPKMLYVITGIAVVALAVWVAFVLRAFKEPWAREPLPNAGGALTTKVAEADANTAEVPASADAANAAKQAAAAAKVAAEGDTKDANAKDADPS
jgi:peptidoglycan/LPS O-acetylase OafA/YrhL